MNLVLNKNVRTDPMRRASESLIFLLVSICLHALLLSGVLFKGLGRGTVREISEKPLELVIKIENDAIKPDIKKATPLKAFPDSKIVSPSDMAESETAPETLRLSDKNTKVPMETIKRGIEAHEVSTPAKKTEPIKKVVAKATITPPENRSSAKSPTTEAPIKNLFLDKNSPLSSSTIQAEEGSLQDSPESETNDNSTASSEARLQSFLGLPGRSDYLPNVADGDLTLLNAKADRFAVFVRRVAIQVFSSLRTGSWADQVEFQKSMSVGDVTIVAELDPTGNFLSANVVENSTIPAFDRAVLNAVRKGAWDKNPPAAALAKNGNIRFIFKSRAQIRRMDQGRYSRWILLATGLE